jgi:glutamyl-Q tRNA(Asp) synthetase
MIGRFAPSPTGPLHFGSLVAAVASFADARAAAGRWLLRIEDVDTTRCRPEHAVDILQTLTRFGFVWDGEVFRQSDRRDVYAAALLRLHASRAVFFCTCSRREIADSVSQDSAFGVDGPVYPGTCRLHLISASPELRGQGGTGHSTAGAWRLNAQAAGEIVFSDRVQGVQQQHVAREVGDFVLQRRDGLFAYQLAVVVDDAEQGVTDIVRGADLLDSTARQIYLQQVLGAPTPRYLHVPVVCDASGQKLSKQTLAPAVSSGDAVTQLQRAWAFLGQAPLALAPSAMPADFWRLAIPAWRVALIPRVKTLRLL